MFIRSAKNREMNVTRNKFSQKNAIVLACSQFLRGNICSPRTIFGISVSILESAVSCKTSYIHQIRFMPKTPKNDLTMLQRLIGTKRIHCIPWGPGTWDSGKGWGVGTALSPLPSPSQSLMYPGFSPPMLCSLQILDTRCCLEMERRQRCLPNEATSSSSRMWAVVLMGSGAFRIPLLFFGLRRYLVRRMWAARWS